MNLNKKIQNFKTFFNVDEMLIFARMRNAVAECQRLALMIEDETDDARREILRLEGEREAQKLFKIYWRESPIYERREELVLGARAENFFLEILNLFKK